MIRSVILNSIIIFSSLASSEHRHFRAQSALVDYVNAHLVNSVSVKVQYPLEHYKDSVSVEYFLEALKVVGEITRRAFFVVYSETGNLDLRQEFGGYKPPQADFTTNTKVFTDVLFVMWSLVLKPSLYLKEVENAPTFLDKIRVAYGNEAFKIAFEGLAGQPYTQWVPNSGCVDVLASDDHRSRPIDDHNNRPGFFSRACDSILLKRKYGRVKNSD
jgi:hypothetical protein